MQKAATEQPVKKAGAEQPAMRKEGKEQPVTKEAGMHEFSDSLSSSLSSLSSEGESSQLSDWAWEAEVAREAVRESATRPSGGLGSESSELSDSRGSQSSEQESSVLSDRAWEKDTQKGATVARLAYAEASFSSTVLESPMGEASEAGAAMEAAMEPVSLRLCVFVS